MALQRKLRVIAKDPGFRWPSHDYLDDRKGEIVTYEIDVPYEDLEPGPRGARVHVIDYLIDSDQLLKPAALWASSDIGTDLHDPFKAAKSNDLIGDPGFHAQNVYALVAKTLARFEFALGRRMEWGFGGHQLKVVPHAFIDANAFYSNDEQALAFGHFPALKKGETIFTCLSHDIVVHEATHALIDGLRTRFMAPSGPDQAAFHEAFSDLVALLSVLETGSVVEAALHDHKGTKRNERDALESGLLLKSKSDAEGLKTSVLGSVARQMGEELYGQGRALRASANLKAEDVDLNKPPYLEEHNRGEVLVAAVMHGYFEVLAARLSTLGHVVFRKEEYVHLGRTVEEAKEIANYLLTMLIRSIDYTPPIHLAFGDFLSAILTADLEVRPDDSKYQFREHLRRSFTAFGIKPAARPGGTEEGCWKPVGFTPRDEGLHFESFRTDPAEVMRYVWANRSETHLNLHPTAYTKIESVRPSVRIAPDNGFPLRETVAECMQIIELPAKALAQHGVTIPAGMAPDRQIRLLGGTTLIFNEFGQLKYDVHNHLPSLASKSSKERATKRLAHQQSSGGFRKGHTLRRQAASIHRSKSFDLSEITEESW